MAGRPGRYQLLLSRLWFQLLTIKAQAIARENAGALTGFRLIVRVVAELSCIPDYLVDVHYGGSPLVWTHATRDEFAESEDPARL
jgi:hypothetical protein